MRMRTFLVLILATLSSSCFNLANAKREVAILHLEAPSQVTNGALVKARTDIQNIDKAPNLKGNTLKIDEESTKLAKMEEGQEKLLKKQVDHLLDAKIEKSFVLKLREGTNFKDIVKKSAEILAKTPSKANILWKALLFLCGGIVTVLVLVTLYGMGITKLLH